MSLRRLMTILSPSSAFLMLALVIGASGDDAPRPFKSVPAATSQDVGRGDSFVGDYVGSIHPLGVYEGKQKPKDGKDFTPKDCGSCHTEAKIERSGTGYSLTMLVDHGKDKGGKPRRERITLKTDRRDKPLTFSNEAYTITVADGEATRGWIKQMATEIKLTRKTELADKPASRKSSP
jgi:hypothetical protein